MSAKIETLTSKENANFDRNTFAFDFIHEKKSTSEAKSTDSQRINNDFDLRLNVLILQ